ncbi:hypothetical protein Ancab_008757 [Ancistrocladus abbreviatus]
MANLTIGASTLEGNRNFFLSPGWDSSYKHELLIPQNFAFNVVLKIRKRKKEVPFFSPGKISNCTVINSVSSTRNSAIIEKDAEFKNSFDEYLKAMESIKAGKEKKKKAENGNGRQIKKGSEVKQNQEDGRTVRLGKFDESEISRQVQLSERSLGVVQLKKMYDFRGEGVEDKGLKFEGERAVDRLSGDLSKKVTKHNNVAHKKSKITKNSRMNTRRSGKGVNEMSDGDELEIERTAFKSSELLDNVEGGPRVSRMEMEERIQKLARCLNGADIEMPEWMFSKMMRSAKIRFSDHSIMRVIQILGKLGNWRRVLQVIEWLQMRERFKSHKLRYVYTAALDALRKAKRPVEALNLFCAMQQRKCSYPDLVAYHCIAVTLGQAGHLKELFDVIDSMRSKPKNIKSGVLEKWNPQLDPDIVVYNAVLNACVRRKQWEGAFWVLQQLKQVGQRPSNATYGLVMEVMLACGKYNLVHEFFEKVQRSSIPNALTYRVLVNALWQEGKTDEAIEAVKEMERRGIVGSASLYYDLACCLCNVGRLQEALTQVDKICKIATKPLVVTYTGLIQTCLDSGRVLDGAYIFNHMHKYCSPNLVTCNIMLKAYLDSGMFDDAKELFQNISQNGTQARSAEHKDVTPDAYTFNTMLEGCVSHKKWDIFGYAYEKMLCHGYHFNTKRHLWMILQASQAGKVELVETTWTHLERADRVPPPALVKERFCLKMEKNDIVAAISTVATHPSTHQQSFSKEAWLKLLEENAHCFRQKALEELIHEINVFLSRSKSPNLIFQHLLDSCKQFVRIDGAVTGVNLIEIQSMKT